MDKDWRDLPEDRKMALMMRLKWRKEAHPGQIPPLEKDWLTYLMLCGRGSGKSRAGAEFVANFALDNPKSRVAVVAATFGDGRDTCFEGESGLLSVLPEVALHRGKVDSAYNRSLGELKLRNGSRFKLYSSEKPRQLRGPQSHVAWCDEIAQWHDAHLGTKDDTTWSNMLLGLRLGDDPRVIATSTPKPNKLILDLANDPKTLRVSWSSYVNLPNLAPTFREQILEKYEGTRLGRQELHAEILQDAEGALWDHGMLEELRCEPAEPEKMEQIVVGVDPALTSGPNADETGIVVCGRDENGRLYVMADLSLRASPDTTARRIVHAYREYQADKIIGESNVGGAWVKQFVHTVDPDVVYDEVHVKRGKRLRAEPVAALFEQHKVFMAGTAKEFELLEAEMCGWEPERDTKSPNRLDACIAKGTAIPTKTGPKPIEDVKAGDFVWTRKGWKQVEKQWLSRVAASLWTIRLSTGHRLYATPDHKIWNGVKWVKAEDIETGTVLPIWSSLQAGNVLKPALVAVVVQSRESSKKADVYDLQVTDAHEFVASGLLVHNCVYAIARIGLKRPPAGPVAPVSMTQENQWLIS